MTLQKKSKDHSKKLQEKKSKYSNSDITMYKMRLDNFWYQCISPDKGLKPEDVEIKDKFIDLIDEFFEKELNIKIKN